MNLSMSITLGIANGGDYNQGGYLIASNDDIKIFISATLLYTYSVCMYV